MSHVIDSITSTGTGAVVLYSDLYAFTNQIKGVGQKFTGDGSRVSEATFNLACSSEAVDVRLEAAITSLTPSGLPDMNNVLTRSINTVNMLSLPVTSVQSSFMRAIFSFDNTFIAVAGVEYALILYAIDKGLSGQSSIPPFIRVSYTPNVVDHSVYYAISNGIWVLTASVNSLLFSVSYIPSVPEGAVTVGTVPPIGDETAGLTLNFGDVHIEFSAEKDMVMNSVTFYPLIFPFVPASTLHVSLREMGSGVVLWAGDVAVNAGGGATAIQTATLQLPSNTQLVEGKTYIFSISQATVQGVGVVALLSSDVAFPEKLVNMMWLSTSFNNTDTVYVPHFHFDGVNITPPLPPVPVDNVPKVVQVDEVLRADWDVKNVDGDKEVAWFHTQFEAQENFTQLSAKIIISCYSTTRGTKNQQQTKECVLVTEDVTVDVRLIAANYSPCGSASVYETMLQDRQNIEDFIRATLVRRQFNFSPQPNLETGRENLEKAEVPAEFRLKYNIRFYDIVIVI
jgi:hypothetical protein